MDNIIQINQVEIKNQLGKLVRETVEDTLNQMLNEEADRITNAHRYEPPPGLTIPIAGYSNRRTTCGARMSLCRYGIKHMVDPTTGTGRSVGCRPASRRYNCLWHFIPL
jgi:hypothetical protein